MLATPFTRLIHCSVPIQQAGMGSLGRPRLAAAAASAGALGMLGWGGAPPDHVARMVEETRRATTGQFGINFIADGWKGTPAGSYDTDALASVKASAPGVRVIEFFYAEPDPVLVDLAHSGGALASWQVGSVAEALAAERSGCDFVVAQGIEAGGHVRGRIGLLALLSQVVPAVRIPIVAAGGIGSGRAMAAALVAGASAVRVGTRFVAAEESEAHPEYVARLINATAADTVLTEAFSTNWPNAPHRVLRDCVDVMRGLTEEVVGERSLPWAPDHRVPVHRGDSIVAMTSTSGNIGAMPHWAGESVDGVRRVEPAARIVQELVDEAQLLIQSGAVT